ncbi:MAG: hypothetical protein IT228_09335 [Flavobacteriales bacterium]|nr:hypothetical protein [Flavobacteriales bacterium]MCC6577530.1 hypothetical protein [Flavobacteriales bacterium]
MGAPVRPLLALAAAALLWAGCSGARSLVKKGIKLDEAGLYAEAADMYLQALQRDQRNVEAKIGLKKAGQSLLNDKLGAFFREVNGSGDLAKAVDTYLDAKAYADRANRLGVVLEIPDHQQREFERVKGEHLVALYTQGQGQLERQEFQAAEATFARIAKLEPGYKDASSLQSIAYMEPLYRAARTDLEAGRYRRAHEALSRVLEKDPAYKDAAALRAEALTKGQYSIAVLPFASSGKRTDLAARLQARTVSGITGSGDPFLKVVDRENLDRILEEQRLGLSGVVDQATAVQVGNLIGAKAVLMGDLISYREEAGKPRSSTKKGFEAYSVRQKVPETGESVLVTKYKPVEYTEHLQQNQVTASFSYRLVSLETGEVLVSNVVDVSEQDQAYYANYTGNRDALLPSLNGVLDPSDRARRDLRALLNAPRQVKPVTTLVDDAMRKAGDRIAGEVVGHLAQKLP